jgi:hypothetical protein
MALKYQLIIYYCPLSSYKLTYVVFLRRKFVQNLRMKIYPKSFHTSFVKIDPRWFWTSTPTADPGS